MFTRGTRFWHIPNSSDSSNLSFALRRKWCSPLHLTATEQKCAVLGKVLSNKKNRSIRSEMIWGLIRTMSTKWCSWSGLNLRNLSFIQLVSHCYHCCCQPLVPFKLALHLNVLPSVISKSLRRSFRSWQCYPWVDARWIRQSCESCEREHRWHRWAPSWNGAPAWQRLKFPKQLWDHA